MPDDNLPRITLGDLLRDLFKAFGELGQKTEEPSLSRPIRITLTTKQMQQLLDGKRLTFKVADVLTIEIVN